MRVDEVMDVDESGSVVTLTARSTSAGVARAMARAWLDAVGWPQPSHDDIVYAINEAVSNAIEHAYSPNEPAGTVELALNVERDRRGTRRVRAEVRDHGRWRPPPADNEGRRRGLVLMRALMDELTIRPGRATETGTSVVLLSRAVPALHPA